MNKELINESVNKYCLDLSSTRINLKGINELIKDYKKLSNNDFSKRYPRCNYNLKELKYYKKQIILKLKNYKSKKVIEKIIL